MEEFRWVNPHQPQTLYMGVILSYIQGVFAILNYPILGPWAFVILVGLVAGGFGIANEKKWGYNLGLAMAFLPFAFRIAFGGVAAIFGVGIVTLMFEVALVALLLHPHSRAYHRIWFS